MHVDIQLFHHHLLKKLSFLHCIVLTPLSELFDQICKVYFWTLNSTGLFICLFASTTQFWLHCFTVCFEIKKCETFFFKIVLGVGNPLKLTLVCKEVPHYYLSKVQFFYIFSVRGKSEYQNLFPGNFYSEFLFFYVWMPWVTDQIQTAIMNVTHTQERSKVTLENTELSIPFPTQ